MSLNLSVVCAFVTLWLGPFWTASVVAQHRYGPPVNIASLKDKSVSESSGLVASRRTPGVYWTHNDSGDGPFIYAFNSRGEASGVFRVTGAQARDWEDIS